MVTKFKAVYVVITDQNHIAGVFSSTKKAQRFIDEWFKFDTPTIKMYDVDFRAKDHPTKFHTTGAHHG